MRSVVKEVFFDYTAGREGYTPFMYCDNLNLVTTGVGDLIDAGPNYSGVSSVERAALNNVVSANAMAPAMRLPWRKRGPGWTSKNPIAGDLVSPAEVADAWTKVKRQNELVPGFAQRGGFAYAGLTDLTLSVDAIRDLFNTTLLNFESTLRGYMPTYDDWPADAQLAVLSMAWAMGPNFPVTFTEFRKAAIREDFDIAGQQCDFKGGGSLSDPNSRNSAHKIMFANAANVVKGETDRDRLYFPTGGVSIPSSPYVHSPSAIVAGLKSNPRIGIAAAVAGTLVAGGFAFAALDALTAKKGRTA